MDTKILESIGFTNGEVKVYLALLDLGSTSSGAIITNSKVSRSKVYDILEKLKEKGLVSEVVKENIKYFEALNPEKILDYIKRKEIELKKEEKEFRKVLPELINKSKHKGEKQEVKVFVGIEGLKTFYNDWLSKMKKKDEYLALTLPQKEFEDKSLVLFLKKFHQKRNEKGVRARILSNLTNIEKRKEVDYSDTGLYEFRITKQTFPTGILIFQDIVATISWGKTPRIFSIESKENTDHYRKFFESLWETAKA